MFLVLERSIVRCGITMNKWGYHSWLNCNQFTSFGCLTLSTLALLLCPAWSEAKENRVSSSAIEILFFVLKRYCQHLSSVVCLFFQIHYSTKCITKLCPATIELSRFHVQISHVLKRSTVPEHSLRSCCSILQICIILVYEWPILNWWTYL